MTTKLSCRYHVRCYRQDPSSRKIDPCTDLRLFDIELPDFSPAVSTPFFQLWDRPDFPSTPRATGAVSHLDASTRLGFDFCPETAAIRSVSRTLRSQANIDRCAHLLQCRVPVPDSYRAGCPWLPRIASVAQFPTTTVCAEVL